MKGFAAQHRNSLIAFAVLLIAVLAYTAFNGTVTIVPMNHPMIVGGQNARAINVSFDHPDTIRAGQKTQIGFRMFDAKTGEKIVKFERINEELLHLIIVNDSLTYFDHVHPAFDGEKFLMSYAFPKDDSYRLYIDYKPVDIDEQQVGFTLLVGAGSNLAPSLVPDTTLSKTVNGYEVKLSAKSFKAKDITNGRSLLTFNITDAKTGVPMTDLRPYLGAFGHLVMIKADTYDYIHAHPVQGPMTDDRGGPKVEFMPMPLDGSPVLPGVYKLFGQFRDAKGLFVAEFTIRLE